MCSRVATRKSAKLILKQGTRGARQRSSGRCRCRARVWWLQCAAPVQRQLIRMQGRNNEGQDRMVGVGVGRKEQRAGEHDSERQNTGGRGAATSCRGRRTRGKRGQSEVRQRRNPDAGQEGNVGTCRVGSSAAGRREMAIVGVEEGRQDRCRCGEDEAGVKLRAWEGGSMSALCVFPARQRRLTWHEGDRGRVKEGSLQSRSRSVVVVVVVAAAVVAVVVVVDGCPMQ